MGPLVAEVCSSASSLPVTGSDAAPVLLVAAGVLAAGCSLLLWRRRARRVASAVAMVLGVLAFAFAPGEPAQAADCTPAVGAVVVSATTTTGPATTSTSLVESSPAGVTTSTSVPGATTTTPTVLGQTSTTAAVTTTTLAGTTTAPTTTLAPPVDVPEVPAPALAGVSAILVLVGARGLLGRRSRPA